MRECIRRCLRHRRVHVPDPEVGRIGIDIAFGLVPGPEVQHVVAPACELEANDHPLLMQEIRQSAQPHDLLVLPNAHGTLEHAALT